MYEYTSDLLYLDFCRPSSMDTVQAISRISTPLECNVWEEVLANHPDQAFSRYICEGIVHGFRIGFQCGSLLRSATTNMDSAQQHPKVISEYLQKELSLGRMLGPFSDTESLPAPIACE